MPQLYAFSARNSRVILNNSVNMLARSWSIGVRVDELDVATFEDLGFTNYEDGLMDADIAVDAFWSVYQNVNGVRPPDGTSTSGTAPPLIYPGTVIPYCYFFIKGAESGLGGVPANQLGLTNGAANVNFFFPQIKVFTAAHSADVRNTVNVSWTAKNVGRFVFPGQLDSANPRNLWK
jgi:hypothetical protein